MKPTLASYIDFLTPFISPDLISEPYLNRIRTIAERLPVLSLGSFECWLDANEPRVDFNVCINPRVNEHATLRDWQPEEAYFENDAYREMQERICSFCTKWSQEDFFLKPLLGELWQVYDIIDPNESSLPVPWVYITYLKNFFDDDQNLKTEIISKTLPIFDNRLPSDLTNKFFRILRTIPASIRIGPIGILKRNKTTSLRLFLEINTFEEIIKVLRQLHWPGNLDEFRVKMTPWAESRRFFGLALDFDGNFQPKIGIEYHFTVGRWQEDMTILTQNLCEQGLCSVTKRDALLGWNGTFEVETMPNFWSWPNRFIEAPKNIPPKVNIQRIANFVKIIFEPNKPLVAKVYPLFLRPVLRQH
jgi:hypothetical protein